MKTKSPNKILPHPQMYSLIKLKYGVDFSTDQPSRHPPYLCYGCFWKTLYEKEWCSNALVRVANWPEHTVTNCPICLQYTIQKKRRESSDLQGNTLAKRHIIKPSPQTPGSGTPTPGSGTQTPGSGTQTPGSGTPTPGSGTPTPGSGTPTPGSGTPTPGSGTPTPGSGTPTPGSGTQTPGSGTQTPGSGTQTPGSGTQTPGSGTPTPGSGTQTPGSGTQTPGSGTPTKVTNRGTPLVVAKSLPSKIAQLITVQQTTKMFNKLTTPTPSNTKLFITPRGTTQLTTPTHKPAKLTTPTPSSTTLMTTPCGTAKLTTPTHKITILTNPTPSSTTSLTTPHRTAQLTSPTSSKTKRSTTQNSKKKNKVQLKLTPMEAKQLVARMNALSACNPSKTSKEHLSTPISPLLNLSCAKRNSNKTYQLTTTIPGKVNEASKTVNLKWTVQPTSNDTTKSTSNQSNASSAEIGEFSTAASKILQAASLVSKRTTQLTTPSSNSNTPLSTTSTSSHTTQSTTSTSSNTTQPTTSTSSHTTQSTTSTSSNTTQPTTSTSNTSQSTTSTSSNTTQSTTTTSTPAPEKTIPWNPFAPKKTSHMNKQLSAPVPIVTQPEVPNELPDEFFKCILQRPLLTPLTRMMEKMATHLFQTKLKQSGEMVTEFHKYGENLTALLVPEKLKKKSQESVLESQKKFIRCVKRIIEEFEEEATPLCEHCVKKDHLINKYRIALYEEKKRRKRERHLERTLAVSDAQPVKRSRNFTSSKLAASSSTTTSSTTTSSTATSSTTPSSTATSSMATSSTTSSTATSTTTTGSTAITDTTTNSTSARRERSSVS
ncbi:uncharacterized protein [Asterias amurensis]|uniref:uncharacterized protein isoform X1 n=1 Tax=Asterias amurensis TaxID=7602 RepID=UPI003AB29B14